MLTMPSSAALGNIPLIPSGPGSSDNTSANAALATLAGVALATSRPSGTGPCQGSASVPSNPVPEQPLQLSVLFPPIPAKLVAKIRAGTYVDMKDLLPDNLALQRQLESLQPSKQASKAKLRKVKSITTWVYCFLAYMAAATTDSCTRDQLTYARLILRETLRTGGDGWAAYDRLLREHAALDGARKLDWTSLDSGLHQATFMRQAGPAGRICSHCRETDHSDAECALAPAKDKAPISGQSPPHQPRGGAPYSPDLSSGPKHWKASASRGIGESADLPPTAGCSMSALPASEQITGQRTAPPRWRTTHTISRIGRRAEPGRPELATRLLVVRTCQAARQLAVQ